LKRLINTLLFLSALVFNATERHGVSVCFVFLIFRFGKLIRRYISWYSVSKLDMHSFLTQIIR